MIVCADCDSERASYTVTNPNRFLCAECFKRARLKLQIAQHEAFAEQRSSFVLVLVLFGLAIAAGVLIVLSNLGVIK